MKILVILIGITIAVLLALLVVSAVLRMLWNSSRGGRVERLTRTAERQLKAAEKAAKDGRHGLSEDHMRLYETLVKQIEQIK